MVPFHAHGIVPGANGPTLGDRTRRVASAVPVSIVIVDDHAMVRSGLRLLLESAGGISVVAEAGDVDTALRCAREHRPDIVLLDINMPGRPSLPAIPELLAAAPGAAVVVMTMQDEPAYARAALTAGASGYVLKEAAEVELLEAVRAAAAGRTYLNPSLGARLVTAAPPAREPSAEVPAAAAVELPIGSTFAGHRIDAVAGRGGMGVVYLATDLTLDRPVALKLIAPGLASDPVFRARFESECKLAAGIDHAHVVQIFHAGEERGLLYVTMRYVQGTDLRTLLGEVGRLPPARAVGIVAQVADALEAAHRRGLVHRDVKPANVLISNRDGGEHAFLTDFGVSKERSADTGLTKTGLCGRDRGLHGARAGPGRRGRRAGGHLRARMRPVPLAHRHRGLRARVRRREDVGAHPRPAARAAGGVSGAASRSGGRARPRARQAARGSPGLGGRAGPRGAGRDLALSGR